MLEDRRRASAARCRAAVFVLAGVLAIAVAVDLWHMPVQVSDSLEEILDAQGSPSVAQSFRNALGTASYLRPLRIAQIKGLYDLANGKYQLAYRGFHALLIVALVWLFVRVLPIETPLDAVAAAVALTVLTGMHTFLSFLREAFPINHFLEIAVFVMIALNLSLSRGGWWVDLLAGLTLAAAALTLESGILVWVVIVTAWLTGLRGVSLRGVVLVTALLAGYFTLRFWYLDTGMPSLTERTSGFLFERLEGSQIQDRFGDRVLVFYAYNVGAALLSIFLSEPRDGLFAATRAWSRSDVHPHAYLTVLSSLALTLMMVGAAAAWWRTRSPLGRSGRLAVVSVVVILANAALSFSYAKDDIIAVAGVFYAIAAFTAIRAVLQYVPGGSVLRAAAIALVVAGLASAWAVRSSGVHHVMNDHAFRTRNDWAELPMQWQRQGRWPTARERLALIEQLRNEALASPIPNPQIVPEWRGRWYGD
jgi:hypothetical protein